MKRLEFRISAVGEHIEALRVDVVVQNLIREEAAYLLARAGYLPGSPTTAERMGSVDVMTMVQPYEGAALDKRAVTWSISYEPSAIGRLNVVYTIRSSALWFPRLVETLKRHVEAEFEQPLTASTMCDVVRITASLPV